MNRAKVASSTLPAGSTKVPPDPFSGDKVVGDADAGTSQTDRATLALREMLIRGQFPPGQRMREIPLAKELGISRIPLRLAMERLAHEGFLEIRPTRGFIAQQFSIADIYDSIELRGLLEGMAARHAAERGYTRTDLATLKSLHEEMVRLVRGQKLNLDYVSHYIDCNSKFHAEILNLSGSRLLRRSIEQVCCLPFASPSAFLKRHYVAPESHELFLISVEHHRGILEAITDHEGARAESISREHARVARHNLERAIQNRDLGESVPGLKLLKL